MVVSISVAAALLLAAGAAVFLIGRSLPESHTVRARAVFDQPPERLWAALEDLESYPSWRTDLQRVELLTSGTQTTRWREIDRKGEGLTYETVERIPPQKLVRRIVDTGLPFGGAWTIELSPLDQGRTEVTITENGEVYNPVFRFMSRYVFGQHGTMAKFLEDLGGRFEEKPAVVRQ
jgi:uncharacterized protein YndB with AHSA1/START domain